MPRTLTPAGQGRARRLDQAKDADRQAAGNDRNRDAADTQLWPGLSDSVSLALPNTNQRRVRP